MPNLLRLDTPHADDGRRWVVGVSVTSRCDQVVAVLLGVSGSGLTAKATIAGMRSVAIPASTTDLFNGLSGPTPYTITSLVTLRTQLTEIEASLVLDLLASLGIAPCRILVIGVHDPGLWDSSGVTPTGYLGLCDSARLAEATGMNVIDAFPARDLAAGGQGGPLTPLAEWVLLRDFLRNRVLLDLGRTIRLSYLPATHTQRAETRILSFEVGPGLQLLDLLAQRFSGGQHHFDPGGRLAVQGKQLPDLVQHWMSNSYFDCPPPRWHPYGVRPERFLADALQMAVASDWSVRDLLCTATHFLAKMIAQTLQSRLPQGTAVDEIVVTGGGQLNGMLLHEIGSLTQRPLLRLDDLGLEIGSLDPAAAALLAILHLDQVPANPTSITQAATPRLLGRLTGGSPQSWQLLLETCANSSTALRPLRTAV